MHTARHEAMLNRRDSIDIILFFVVMFVDDLARLRLHLHEILPFLAELIAPVQRLLHPTCGQLCVCRQGLVQLLQHWQIPRPR